MKTPAPKHRAIIHLAADMRKGAGAHSVARKPGPSVEEWDDEPTVISITQWSHADDDARFTQPDGQGS